ncbi:plasmid mobilization protein [Komagataeibacter sp. FXV3]|uniref:plasmid mobilization protein n=1 Tax=Komagataeibacter sp. FXV3 TaxID=2608998 RepID=UPI00187B32F4|nr:plasmid mobilization relaxosome protein MobC [Komagataeibacter sp. FXV3]MBE7729844.1 MobC family plasmid mobilization relaxosome protein [Komagataeibacter sp. FXV3]
MQKLETIHVRITDIEKQELQNFAQKSPHKNLSTFFRFVCSEYRALGKSGTDLLNEIIILRREISAIGNNLNQIAKKINQNNNVAFDDELKEINAMNKKLNSLLSKIRPVRYAKKESIPQVK